MNIWNWLKLAFAPKQSDRNRQSSINYALESEIMRVRNLILYHSNLRDQALLDAIKAKARKKKSSPYQAIAQRAQSNVLAYEIELAELEKRRG